MVPRLLVTTEKRLAVDPGNDGALDASLPAVVPVPDAGLSAQELDLELVAGLVRRTKAPGSLSRVRRVC